LPFPLTDIENLYRPMWTARERPGPSLGLVQGRNGPLFRDKPFELDFNLFWRYVSHGGTRLK
jgi:hypothetical protein